MPCTLQLSFTSFGRVKRKNGMLFTFIKKIVGTWARARRHGERSDRER
jgi:hypothetical protein